MSSFPLVAVTATLSVAFLITLQNIQGDLKQGHEYMLVPNVLCLVLFGYIVVSCLQ